MLLALALALCTTLSSRAAPADATAPAATGEPSEDAAKSPVDWAACLDCHELADAGLPELSKFRPSAFAMPIATCEDCHQPLDLVGPHVEWTHPVRSVAAHLSCTDCHVATPHGAETSPPLPYGDYDQAGCFECHRDVSAALASIWSHGSDPRVRCRDCHPAHEPLRAALPLQLLPSTVREGWQGVGDWYQNNAACLQCHPPASLMMSLDQGFVTLNTTNYHQLHLDGGLFCVECHEPHGSRHRGMIRDTLLDGRLLQFDELIDGASCTVTCHGVAHQDWRYINQVY